MSKLTLKQKRFADEYIISGNATEAAIKAGYSTKTARFIGNENLTKPNIRKYIDEKLNQLDKEKVLSIEETMRIMSSIARGEPRKIKKIVTGADGTSYEVEEYDYPKYSDMNKAYELFLKVKSMISDRIQIEGRMTNEVVINIVGDDNDDS